MKKTVMIFALTTALIVLKVNAGFNIAGYDLQVVASDKGLVNGAVSFQTNPLWLTATPDKPYSLTTSFNLPATEEILFSRLYFNIWGGTNNYTCRLEMSINGIDADIVDIGGQNDLNAVYEPNQICVYGSGFGSWQIGYNDVEDMLNLDGSENSVSLTISDPSGQFDGRVIDASLFVVYTDPLAEYAVDYYLAEADGYMRRVPSTPNAPDNRTVFFDNIAMDDLLSANYTTLYTHGTEGQKDMLFFNDVQLGGDDIAIGQGGIYGPDVVSFDVTDLLQSSNVAVYTVDEEITGSVSEAVVNSKVAILEVRRAYCDNPPIGDTNKDCRVDMIDLAAIAASWLECNLVPQNTCFN